MKLFTYESKIIDDYIAPGIKPDTYIMKNWKHISANYQFEDYGHKRTFND